MLFDEYYQTKIIPVNILEELTTHYDVGVRQIVANNPNTPVNSLAILATDSYYYVRKGVANNPITSANILEILATDSHGYIRKSVANNPNTSIYKYLINTSTDFYESDIPFI